jgi:hypothetical protein
MPHLTPCRLLLLIPAFLALFASLPIIEGHAQEARTTSTATDGTGLEIDNYQTVKVLVGGLSKDAEQIGLTEDRLQTRVEIRLRQAKLKPVKEGEPGDRSDAYLYVNVSVGDNAFAIDVAFSRGVFYAVGTGTKTCLARTWSTSTAGTHGNASEFIVQSLDALLDKFLNEYLKANGQ